jgi:hypothetical protein
MAISTNFGVPTGTTAAGAQTLMPKLQYRFRVTFTGLGLATKTTELVTQNVISATRPGLDHDDITIDTYNSKIRLAGKHMWQDITVVLRDDTTNNVIHAIREQLNKQVNQATHTSPASGNDYKFTMKIETLDGSSGSTVGVMDTWFMEGCFIPSATFGDLNYATSDVVQVSMTIRFDNAQLSTPTDGTATTSTDSAFILNQLPS